MNETSPHKIQHILVSQNQSWVTLAWQVFNWTTLQLLPHSSVRVATSRRGMGQSSRGKKQRSHLQIRHPYLSTRIPGPVGACLYLCTLQGRSADMAMGINPPPRVLQEHRATDSSSHAMWEEFSPSP